jgi:hypothetical protein
MTSVQRNIEPRTGRGRGFALEWPKVGGRSHREARAVFKWRIPLLTPAAGISGDYGTNFVSVRRIAFLPGTFGRCGKVTATAVKAYGY